MTGELNEAENVPFSATMHWLDKKIGMNNMYVCMNIDIGTIS